MKGPLPAIVLALSLSLTASAQEPAPRRVRLELQDGTVVEGRLEAFAGRIYRVVTAEGVTREVAEKDVARVGFDAAGPSGTPTACAALADVLRRAEASGALAARVLGRRHLLLTEVHHQKPGDEGLERRFLVAADVRKEADALTVELEVSGARDSEHDPMFFDLDADAASYRLRYAVGLSDGRARSGAAAAGGRSFTWKRQGEAWRVEVREGEEGGARDFPWSDDLLLEPVLVFVLAPLQDQGLPPSLSLRLLRPKRPDGAADVRRLRRLPGQGTVELSHESHGEPRPALRVQLGPDGRLAGFETESLALRGDTSYVAVALRAEVIDAARWADELAAWGAGPAPPLAAPAPAAPVPAGDPGPPGAAAPLLAAARARGARDPLLVERWFVRRSPRGASEVAARLLREATGASVHDRAGWRRAVASAECVQLVRTVGRRDAERLTLETTEETPGAPERATRDASTYDAEGRLVELVRESWASDGSAVTVRLARRGDRLEGVEERRRAPLGGWSGDARKVDVGGRVPAGAVCMTLARYGLPALGSLLDAPLELVAVGAPSSLLGGRPSELPLLLERRPVPEGSRALDLGPTRRARVLDGPSPAAAVVLSRRGGRNEPLEVVFTDATGALLACVGPEEAGRAEPGAVLLAATKAEVEALRADPRVLAAGRCLREQELAGSVRFALLGLHGKQEAFRSGDLDHDGEPDFAASLEELGATAQVDAPLRAGVRPGYRVVVVRAANAPGERWLAVANPLEPSEDAPSLAITQDGEVLRGPGPFEARPDAAPPAGAEPFEPRDGGR